VKRLHRRRRAGRHRSGRLVLLLTAGLLFAAALGAQAPELRRFALIAGANDGGYDRIRLRYAVSDARTFAAVMEALGGVRRENQILLVDPEYGEFQDGLRRIQQMIAAAGGGRTELLVYYSGHSDEEGLLLGRERYPYSRLRREIAAIEADVRVTILDSCSSGTITRTKGGVARPAFLLDTASDTRGYAFLTSSSEDEVAQESDRIGGSYFTHFLVSGLRGAADSSSDGLVTLNEAYHYAFTETMASTESTRYGPQHPAYDINLSGTGDLVLTDLRATSGRLTVAPALEGRLFIRDRRELLVAEINKRGGEEVSLGVDPGVYTVRLVDSGETYETRVRVEPGLPAAVGISDLRRVGREPATGRGEGDPGAPASAAYLRRSVHVGILPGVGSDGLFASRDAHRVSLNLLMGHAASIGLLQAAGIAGLVADELEGAQLAGIGGVVGQNLDGVQAAGVVNVVGRDARWAQLAGVLNITRGRVSGAQTAGAVNLALGGLAGAQVSGLAGLSGEDVRGLQVSGGFSGAMGSVSGAQVSGLAGAAGELTGLQLSGLLNYSRSGRGVQIGLLNIGSALTGAQVGLVNIAGRVRGTQVGLVNIARNLDGLPVGLINLERNGSRHIELWWSGDNQYNFALRLGAGFVYTLIRAGFAPGSDPLAWSCGAGLGVQLPMQAFFLNADFAAVQRLQGTTTFEAYDPATLAAGARLAAGFSPGGSFGLLAGAALDLEIPGWHLERGSAVRVTARPYLGLQFGRPAGR
jgi:hypothetical protein